MRKSMKKTLFILFSLLLMLPILAQADGVPAATKIYPQYGRLAFGGVTGSSAGTANAVATLTRDRYIVYVVNSLNQEVSITYDGVEIARFETTDRAMVIDLRTSGLKMESGKIIGVYHQGVAPTGGSIRVTAL